MNVDGLVLDPENPPTKEALMEFLQERNLAVQIKDVSIQHQDGTWHINWSFDA